jgi:hypothetical protein
MTPSTRSFTVARCTTWCTTCAANVSTVERVSSTVGIVGSVASAVETKRSRIASVLAETSMRMATAVRAMPRSRIKARNAARNFARESSLRPVVLGLESVHHHGRRCLRHAIEHRCADEVVDDTTAADVEGARVIGGDTSECVVAVAQSMLRIDDDHALVLPAGRDRLGVGSTFRALG